MKIPATVGILTYNSAQTLRRTLESVKEFSDIIICDGGSTDGTQSIALEYGARVIPQHPAYKNADGSLSDYGAARNQCLDAAAHDWFFYIDSDETASPGLVGDIRAAVAKPAGALVYRVPIGIMMDGRYIKHSSNYPGWQYRFFNKRSGARFARPVHERIEFAPQELGTFVHPWYVHTTRAYWLHYVRETSGYRPLEVAKACAEPWRQFVRSAPRQVRMSAGVLLRSLWIYARYGFGESLPVRGELGRAVAPLVLVSKVLVCKLSKKSTS